MFAEPSTAFGTLDHLVSDAGDSEGRAVQGMSSPMQRVIDVKPHRILPALAPRCASLLRRGPRKDVSRAAGKIIFRFHRCIRSSVGRHANYGRRRRVRNADKSLAQEVLEQEDSREQRGARRHPQPTTDPAGKPSMRERTPGS